MYNIPDGFWDEWKENKAELKSKGFAPFKAWDGWYLAVYNGNKITQGKYENHQTVCKHAGCDGRCPPAHRLSRQRGSLQGRLRILEAHLSRHRHLCQYLHRLAGDNLLRSLAHYCRHARCQLVYHRRDERPRQCHLLPWCSFYPEYDWPFTPGSVYHYRQRPS